MDFLRITTVSDNLLFALFGERPTPPEGMVWDELHIYTDTTFVDHDTGVYSDVQLVPLPTARAEDLPYYEPDPLPTYQFTFWITHAGTTVTTHIIIPSTSIKTLALFCTVAP